jgi:DNA-binding CsgD family transcriptional regulator
VIESGGEAGVAANLAALISWDYSFFKGERAVAEGWLSRAESLLDGNAQSAQTGWVLLRRASLLADTDAEAAARLADEAVTIARAERSVDLEVAAVSLRGLTLVEQGILDSGMRLLAEGAAAACAGETDHPVAVTLACCYTIGACERARDFEGAGQWVPRMVDRFERRNVPSFASFCRAQYGAVLLALGQWHRAGEVLEREVRALDPVAPSAAAFARTRLAELRRRQGLTVQARALLEQAEPHPACLLVRAAMALDANAADEALDAVDAYLRRTSADRVLDRVRGLELVVRTHAARGAVAEAKACADELNALVEPIGAPAFEASALVATAMARSCADELQPAREAFEDAAALFEQSQMPWEAALAWEGAALADEGLGRSAAARRERRRSASLLRALAGAGNTSLLTGREREILALVAEGLSDGGIAARLVLSRHTVHRHVANAMRKLGASTRAAAVARATQLGLL